MNDEVLSLKEENELIKIKNEFEQDKKNGKVLKASTVDELIEQLDK